MADEYKISKEDIKSALLYLKHFDSENATEENAKALLEDLKTGYHGLNLHDPERLKELKKQLDKNRLSSDD